MENCIDFWKTHPEVLVTGIHEPLAEETYKNRIPLLKVGDEKLFCLSIDAPGKLDLLHHLVCTVVKFLFGGDDAEQVQDECQQEHRYEDEHHRTEIVDITILTFQYGRRDPAGPALLGRRPAGCFELKDRHSGRAAIELEHQYRSTLSVISCPDLSGVF